MGVVDLDSDIIRHFTQGQPIAFKAFQHALTAGADKKVFLAQAQDLTALVGIVRIQDLRDDFTIVFFLDGLSIIPFGEAAVIDRIVYYFRFPQAQRIDIIVMIADIGRVIRHSQNSFIILIGDIIFSVVSPYMDVSAEFDFAGFILTADLPDIFIFQPVV